MGRRNVKGSEEVWYRVLDFGKSLQDGFFSSTFLGLFCRDVELLSSRDGAATSAIATTGTSIRAHLICHYVIPPKIIFCYLHSSRDLLSAHGYRDRYADTKL